MIPYDFKNLAIDYETIHTRLRRDNPQDKRDDNTHKTTLKVIINNGEISLELRHNGWLFIDTKTVTLETYKRVINEFYSIENPEDVYF